MKTNFLKIAALIEKGVKKGDFPGGQYSLVENGKIYSGYSGYSSLYPHKTILSGNEVYDIASLTKVVSTTILILQLIEKKKLSLKTPIKTILNDYFSDKTTIFDLLTHQSGLPPIVSNSANLFSEEDLKAEIFKERFKYDPNQKIVYSDVGFKILGFVVEKLYQERLDKVAKREIFAKLKMTKTTYRPDYYLSTTTEYRDDALFKGYVRGVVHDERAFLLKGIAGHAGVFSTAADLAKFIVSILNDEKILTNKSKKELFATTIIKENANGNNVARSLGYQKFINLPNTHSYLIGHTGFTGCNLWIDSKNKRGFVLLTNAIHPKREDNKIFSYREEILKMFY